MHHSDQLELQDLRERVALLEGQMAGLLSRLEPRPVKHPAGILVALSEEEHAEIMKQRARAERNRGDQDEG